ncbi:MAG: hypothetical protein M1819_002080 [Sarea resinae]|nr:MAG: hypothetical protein M1819_002080 [Sarea resinae]
MGFPTALVSLVGLCALFATANAASNHTGTNNTDCSCGYYDASTQELFTESTIIYFNESTGMPIEDFEAETYTHAYEKDWNSVFREGALSSNIALNNASASRSPFQSLEMGILPYTHSHVVPGSSLRSLRRDIQYGSFRSLMRGPPAYAGGSALTMMLWFNDTEQIQMNIQNTDEPDMAWVSTLINDDFPSRDLGLNFSTVALNASINATESLWNYTEYRMDWTNKEINFYIGGNLTRSVKKSHYSGFPTVPLPLYFKHHSQGDTYAMQGPPRNASVANVGWVRMFFNSSLMSHDDHKEFDKRCLKVAEADAACSMEDLKLRGSTAFPGAATLKWKQKPYHWSARWVPIAIAVASISMSTFLVVNAIIQRKPWQKVIALKEKRRVKKLGASGPTSGDLTPEEMAPSGAETPLPLYETRPPTPVNDQVVQRVDGPPDETGNVTKIRYSIEGAGATRPGLAVGVTSENEIVQEHHVHAPNVIASEKGKNADVTVTAVPPGTAPTTAAQAATLPRVRQRVDHLAGLVAMSSIIVTVTHFVLTFVPASFSPGSYAHYKSETWTRKTINAYLLNQNWIGPFLTSSTRFLVMGYLRNGKLSGVAEKVVSRVFRLMIPITAIVLLEYFFSDAGALKWLEYLPSVTWSTWPFTVEFTSFGNFVSEILELVYLIPNGVPQITFNYCTGVLWTVPVQLQGSWIVLLGVIMIREVKTPWKRFAFYAFVVVNHWYALSWGSYFWLGLMLADLDITFKYKKWLYSHLWVYYPVVIFCAACGIGGLTHDLVSQWTGVNYSTVQYGIHPDIQSGLPIAQTFSPGYPQYYVPKINGLVFCVGFQALIEISPFAQKIFSFKLFLLLFPHIFTIYLIHGFVFWSWGSWICVFLSTRGVPYWANMLITAITCYAVLLLSLPFLTPLNDTLGKRITANIWQMAHERPPPRKPTLYPFPRDLFLKREENGSVYEGQVASSDTSHIEKDEKSPFED